MCIDKKESCCKIVSVLFLLLGVSIPFFLMRYSINFSDEPYQILNAMDYSQSPSTIFSAYIYNILGNCFGFELLQMRTMMAIISIATIVIPLIYFYWKRNNVWETMFVGGIALVLLSAVQQRSTLVGWDILSNLFLSASTVIMLIYIERNKSMVILALLGVLVAMATMSRIPNIMLLPIALVTILIDKKYTNKVRDIIVFFSSVSISVLVIIYWIYGDVNSYIYAWNEWGYTENHNILNLLDMYVSDSISLVCIVGLIVMVYLSLYIITQYDAIKFLHRRKYIVVIIWLLFFIKLLYRYEYINILTNSLYNSIYLLMLMYVWCKNRINIGNSTDNKILLILFMCSLVSAIGSDTGCFKIANVTSMVFLLPKFLPIASKTANNTIAIVVVSILIYFPCNKARELFRDEGLVQSTVKLNLPYISGIYTTPANSEILKEVYEAEKRSSAQDVLFVGFGRQIFEYILDCRANYAHHSFLGILDNEKYVLETKAYLEQNPTINRVYVVNKNNLDYTLMNMMIEEKGYELCKTTSCYHTYNKVIAK